MEEENPRLWMFEDFGSGDYGAHPGGQQKKIMPVLLLETASYLPTAATTVAASRQPPSNASSLQEMVRTRKMRSVASRRQTGALPEDA